MSDRGDDEFEYEWPSGDENDGAGDDGEVMIQNTFYEAEDNKKNNPEEALEQFENVVTMEEQTGDEIKYRFKALENIVILSAQLGKYENMVSKQKTLLKNINKVARNDASEAISNILDAVSQYLIAVQDYQKQMYQMTLEVLKSNNERLWFNICLRLGKMYLDSNQFESLDLLLIELKGNCKLQNDPQNYDPSKGNMLLEAFALEIQMCVAQKNNKRMKSVYPQTTSLNSVINDPRVLGIVKECGGKMYMSEKKWDKAQEELFECFKNYQESGNSRAKTVLKYVIMASILSGSQINYAETREAKVYEGDQQITAIILLRTAFENNDMELIQSILNDKKNQILDDPFINIYLDDLLRNIRLNVLAAKVKPYKSISLEYLAVQLNITKEDVRSLLSELILEEKIKGEIDQLNGYLELQMGGGMNQSSQKYAAMRDWAKVMNNLQGQLTKKFS